MPASSTDSLEAEVERLGTLDLNQLRVQFRNRTGRLAPMHLSRTLLFRVLAHRIQAEAHGDLRPETRRLLDKLGKAGGIGSERESKAAPAVARPSRPKRGSVLVREWRGRMEHVMVIDDGYVWAGTTYPSLSAVAGAITGTKWNGRRFFGLDRPNDTASPSATVRRAVPSVRSIASPLGAAP